MPTHWTYDDSVSNDDLSQGDILDRTDDLLNILRQFHQHFATDKYVGFLVVTQSCDLVYRESKCKAPYISIAAIRSAGSVLPDILKEICQSGIPQVLSSDSRGRASELLSRILNQNEQSLGLFYLHPDADVGIADNSVAMLRVTISLRSSHYEVLRQARRGRLNNQFASKLGWLVGNLYARVATPDWRDAAGGEKEQKRLVDELLKSGSLSDCNWLSKTQIKSLQNHGIDFSQLDREQISAAIKNARPLNAKQQAIERVKQIVGDVAKNIDEKTLDSIVTRLTNDQQFKQSCRD